MHVWDIFKPSRPLSMNDARSPSNNLKHEINLPYLLDSQISLYLVDLSEKMKKSQTLTAIKYYET